MVWIFSKIFRNILSNVLSLHAFLSFECSAWISLCSLGGSWRNQAHLNLNPALSPRDWPVYKTYSKKKAPPRCSKTISGQRSSTQPKYCFLRGSEWFAKTSEANWRSFSTNSSHTWILAWATDDAALLAPWYLLQVNLLNNPTQKAFFFSLNFSLHASLMLL